MNIRGDFTLYEAAPEEGWSRRESHSLTITTFNVQNLFDLISEPGKRDFRTIPSPFELEVKLEKLALAIRQELRCPELLVVQEVDNQVVLQEVGDRVNAAAGTRYSAVSYETSDLRSIEVGFLYDSARVSLRESFQLSGMDVERAFGGYSPSPGREPIVGIFEAVGTEFTVVGNHFKSRGGFILDPEERLAMDRATEEQRRDQARVVRRFVNGIFDRSPDTMLAVAGDFNDFHYIEPEPLDGRPLSLLQGGEGEIPLFDVVERVPEESRYTFVHRGAAHVLDHIFVSPAMERMITAVSIPHFNAGFPLELAVDHHTPRRSSDHDPVVLRLAFPLSANPSSEGLGWQLRSPG